MKSFSKPKKLKKGDTIGVIAPSDAIERTYITQGVSLIESWGLKTKLGKHLFSYVGDFAAGTASERREDITRMIEDPDIKVIWSAIGGYAATEVLPAFTPGIMKKLQSKPKWFIGYSDVCVLLNVLASNKIASIHGPNLSGIMTWDEKTRKWLKDMLFDGDNFEIGSEANWKILISGEAQGQLLTSNLDALITTFGTKYDPLMHGTSDVILGIEEWWIDKSTLQRQVDTILNHKKSDRIKGLILGRFVGIGEQSYPEWGKKVTSHALIEGRVRVKGGIPLVVLSDFGHPSEKGWFEEKFPVFSKPDSFLSLPNGIQVKLSADSSSATLKFLEKVTD